MFFSAEPGSVEEDKPFFGEVAPSFDKLPAHASTIHLCPHITPTKMPLEPLCEMALVPNCDDGDEDKIECSNGVTIPH